MKKMCSVAALTAALALTVTAAAAGTEVAVSYQPPPYPEGAKKGNHILCGWFGDHNYKDFQVNDMFQVGGWGDQYRSYCKWDLRGLPTKVTKATITLHDFNREGQNSPLVSYWVYTPAAEWATIDRTYGDDGEYLTTTMNWDTQPALNTLIGTWDPGEMDTAWTIDITSTYLGWRSATIPNHGLVYIPTDSSSGQYDTWRSPRYMDYPGARPALGLWFPRPADEPVFKLPLPKRTAWQLQSEDGGYNCLGQYDPLNDDAGFFGINFGYVNKGPDGLPVYGNPNDGAKIPVTPSADGHVAEVGTNPNARLGYYVIVSHNPASNDPKKGWATVYAHLKFLPTLSVGDAVIQGKTRLGFMGCTGTDKGVPTCTSPNLRFSIQYDGKSDPKSTASYATVNGLLLRQYQTECSTDGQIISFYPGKNGHQ